MCKEVEDSESKSSDKKPDLPPAQSAPTPPKNSVRPPPRRVSSASLHSKPIASADPGGEDVSTSLSSNQDYYEYSYSYASTNGTTPANK